MTCTDHKRIEAVFWDTASILSTQVNEVGSSRVFKILVIDPVALLECAVVLEIKVVH